jgi:excisionase family DNA binding protein
MEQHRILTASPIDPLVEAIAVRVVELPKSGDEPRLLTVAEASKYISRSQRSVRQMIADGVLPVMREGRAVRLDRAELDAGLI